MHRDADLSSIIPIIRGADSLLVWPNAAVAWLHEKISMDDFCGAIYSVYTPGLRSMMNRVAAAPRLSTYRDNIRKYISNLISNICDDVLVVRRSGTKFGATAVKLATEANAVCRIVEVNS
jgi:hypothetical protein